MVEKSINVETALKKILYANNSVTQRDMKKAKAK